MKMETQHTKIYRMLLNRSKVEDYGNKKNDIK